MAVLLQQQQQQRRHYCSHSSSRRIGDAHTDRITNAIADRINGFKIPEVDLPDRGSSTAALAEAGIYDADQERDKVFKPLLAGWKIFDRTDLGEDGLKAREELAHLA